MVATQRVASSHLSRVKDLAQQVPEPAPAKPKYLLSLPVVEQKTSPSSEMSEGQNMEAEAARLTAFVSRPQPVLKSSSRRGRMLQKLTTTQVCYLELKY